MHIVFLPGAGGAPEFWHPLGALLPAAWRKTYLAWPGLGKQPQVAGVNGFDDLVALAAAQLSEPSVVIAQSMGGVVGVRLALEYPQHVSHLILVATSGGLDVAALGGADWRAAYLNTFPQTQQWITTAMPDLGARLPQIRCPTLLIWGERDPVSPPLVGQTLAARIPHAQLAIVEGGDHDLGRDKAAGIAPLILRHIAASGA